MKSVSVHIELNSKCTNVRICYTYLLVNTNIDLRRIK